MSNIPIRCFTCGKVIASIFDGEYTQRVEAGEDPYEVLDDLKIGRPCCRRMFTTHVDINRFSILYPTHSERIHRVGPKHNTRKEWNEEDELEESSKDDEPEVDDLEAEEGDPDEEAKQDEEDSDEDEEVEEDEEGSDEDVDPEEDEGVDDE